MSGLDTSLAAIGALAGLGARFVGWRWEQRGGKPTKPPIDPHTGGFASAVDPSTWAELVHVQATCCARGWRGGHR
jgi:hypothetical protein